MGRTVSSLLFWKWKWKLLSCVWLFATPRTIQPWNSPGQDTGVDNLSLLQGIFPNQELHPGLLHCRQILYPLNRKGSPRGKNLAPNTCLINGHHHFKNNNKERSGLRIQILGAATYWMPFNGRLCELFFVGFPCGSACKKSTCNERDLGSVLGLGRSPGEGKGYPLQCSGMENSTDSISPWGHRVWHSWATFIV